MSTKLSQQQIDRLSFLGESVYYNFTNKIEEGYTINSDNFAKLKKLFLNESSVANIPKNSKGYIVSSKKLALKTVRDTCKTLEYKVTDSIENADFFIVDEDAFSTWYTERNHGKIACKVDSCREIICSDQDKPYLKPSNMCRNDNTDYYPPTNIVTENGLSIIYKLLSSKIPVISADTLFKSIEKVTIDKEMYESIVSMLCSHDNDSKQVGLEILYNCDIKNSSFYIWKMMKITDCRYAVLYPNENKNTKIAKDFRNKTSKLTYADNENILDYLHDQLLLTEDIYNEIITDIYQEAVEALRYLPNQRFVNIQLNKNSYLDYLANRQSESKEVNEVHDYN